MKLNKKKFFLYLNKYLLTEKYPIIAVAVSGGPDSMALICLMSEWIKIKKGKIIALLIDHQLRFESKSECKIIKNYLKRLNIESKIIKVSIKALNKKNMNEARNNRYNKLINYCKKNKILHLFIGHHHDDNLETFLIRKIAGSNLEGLGSMRFKVVRDKIQIVRPLLNYTKNEILEYNKINKIKFINDPSNNNTKYTRVFIRNYLNQKSHTRFIEKDFKNISKFIHPYKIMIIEILNQIAFNIKKKHIVLSFEEFIKLDKLIKEKILEKIHNHLNNRDIRTSKIRILLAELNKNPIKRINIASIIVSKNKNLLYFSVNH